MIADGALIEFSGSLEELDRGSCQPRQQCTNVNTLRLMPDTTKRQPYGSQNSRCVSVSKCCPESISLLVISGDALVAAARRPADVLDRGRRDEPVSPSE